MDSLRDNISASALRLTWVTGSRQWWSGGRSLLFTTLLTTLLTTGPALSESPPPTPDIAAGARFLLLGPTAAEAPVEVSHLAEAQSERVALRTGQALILQWPETRTIRGLEVDFAGPLPESHELHLSWWLSEGWEHPSRLDDLTHGRWVESPVALAVEAGRFRLTFPPLTEAELFPLFGEAGANRRTRQLGLRCSREVFINRVRVPSNAPLRPASLWVEWNLEGQTRAAKQPEFRMRNGTIRRVQKSGRAAATVELEYGHEEDPLSPEAGRLLFEAGPRQGFAVNVTEALAREGIWVRDLGVFVADARSGLRYRDWIAGPERQATVCRILDRVAMAGEEAFTTALEAACIERPGATILGLPGGRQDFIVFPDGSLELRTGAIRTPGLDTLARPWPWPAVRWEFLTGTTPRRPAKARGFLQDGWLPVWCQDWQEEGLRWQRRSLACSLPPPWLETGDPDGTDLVVLANEFTVTNLTAAPRTATLWIELQPAVPLRLTVDGTLVLDRPSDGKLRPGLLPVRGRFERNGQGSWDLRVAQVRQATSEGAGPVRSFACYQVVLEAGEAHTFAFFVPGVELLTAGEAALLKELSARTCFEEAIEHWRALLERSAKLDVPVPLLNELFRANLWRTLSAMAPEPATGAWHLKTPFGAGRVPLDEVATIATLFDRRGEHAAAARLLAPAWQNQGRNAPRGSFPSHPGALCAQHPESPDPFGQDTPAWQHGRLLSALARHLLLDLESTFRELPLAKLLLAANWILYTLPPDGGAPPAGISPDQNDVQAFATDAAFLGGLRDLARALDAASSAPWMEGSQRNDLRRAGQKLREQAEAYGDRILAGLDRTIVKAPVAPLRDGTWLPSVPWRWDAPTPSLADGRHELACSPLWLVTAGAMAAQDPPTAWLLANLEDNVLPGRMAAATGASLQGSIDVARPSPATLAAPLGPVFIARGEVASFWWTVRNLLANRLDRATVSLMGSERAEANAPGSFPSALAEECRLIHWLLDALVFEHDEGLDLCAAAPRAWFRDGQSIRLHGLRTGFGALELEVRSRLGAGAIEATVRLTGPRLPERFRLRLRHPQGQEPREVTVNGRHVRADGEWVPLSLGGNAAEVIARF